MTSPATSILTGPPTSQGPGLATALLEGGRADERESGRAGIVLTGVRPIDSAGESALEWSDDDGSGGIADLRRLGVGTAPTRPGVEGGRIIPSGGCVAPLSGRVSVSAGVDGAC